jgi:mRNA-degrading endonuclease RelE of RelBE toxin-antitoxin system
MSRDETPWKVVIAPGARKDLLRLPESIAWAAMALVTDRLPYNPHRIGGELAGPLVGKRSARLGTYRAVFRIDEDARTVYVLGIKLRADVYGIRQS